ncbi:MAG TPA: 3'-5' exonuclease [Dehalococcoidia bacterium]|nr:3'-5' exonuclease [Dehalococcoidia bacterium]
MKSTTVFVDIETDGLRPDANIIQVAAVAVIRGIITEHFERKIQFDPGVSNMVEPDALAANCYNAFAWEMEAVPEGQVLREFAVFLGNHATVQKVSKAGYSYKVARLAGYNIAEFDMPRLVARYRALDIFFPADYQALDTLHLARWYFQAHPPWPANLQLGTLCAHFGIPTPDAHDAMGDVEATAALAAKLQQDVRRPAETLLAACKAALLNYDQMDAAGYSVPLMAETYGQLRAAIKAEEEHKC